MTAARGAPGTASAVLFFVGPVLVLLAAVGLRTSGAVESTTSVIARLRPLVPLARKVARAEGVPLDLLLAVASAESGGRADARSHKGAVGIMQLRPGTAADMADRGREPAPDLRDPGDSLRLGARYLALQRRRFRSHALADELALCAYNAGPARVTGWLTERPLDPAATTLGSWIPYRETRDYVRRVASWRARWAAVLAREVPSGPEPGN